MEKFTKIQKLSDNQFLNLYKMDALTREGRAFDYYFVSRNGAENLKLRTKEDTAEGIVIYPVFKEDPEKIVIIRQYRYPLDEYIYELPAGLKDAGEDAEQAAIREMKEETGLEFSPWLEGNKAYRRPFFMGPGYTDESSQTVFGYASGDISTSFQEDTERIQVLLVGKEEAGRILARERVSLRCAFLLMHFIQSRGDNPFQFLT